MTDAASEVLLWSDDKKRLGKWSTREGKTIGALSCLLCFLFRKHLIGTQRANVQEHAEICPISFAAEKPQDYREDRYLTNELIDEL